MVKVLFEFRFERKFKRIQNSGLKNKILKQITKIGENPEVGKPMRYSRKSTREVYVGSYRIMYKYYREKDIIIFCDFYHKDNQ